MVNLVFIYAFQSYEYKMVRKHGWDFVFHSGFFLFCPLAILFLPQWLCLTSNPRNLKPTEMVNTDSSVWYLSEPSSWVKEQNSKAGESSRIFPSSIRSSKCASAQLSPLFPFSSVVVPPVLSVTISLPSPLRYLDSCGRMCVLQRLWPWHRV